MDIYHFHAVVGLVGKQECGLANKHDPDCSKGILTIANEQTCKNVGKRAPVGRPDKCWHDVPADFLAAGDPGLDIWIARRPEPKGRAEERTNRAGLLRPR